MFYSQTGFLPGSQSPVLFWVTYCLLSVGPYNSQTATRTRHPAMKPYLAALMYALLESTNYYQLERPGYIFWNHVLVSRSNMNTRNHLWTGPEHPAITRVGESEDFDRSYYDEDEDKLDNDNRSEDESREVADSRVLDPDYDPDDSLQTTSFFDHALPRRSAEVPVDVQKASPPPELQQSAPEPLKSASEYYLRSRKPSPIHDHPPVAAQAGFGATTSGPVRKRYERIVDFGVNYLEIDDASKKSDVLHFKLRNLKPVKVPIVVEGKRAPDRVTNINAETFQVRLTYLLNLAYQDFDEKRRFFFEAYSCKSFVAIAFAGPYWSFAICRSDLSPLTWSQPISVESTAHKTILDTIFAVAEAHPNDPGMDMRMKGLIRQYQRNGTFEVILK